MSKIVGKKDKKDKKDPLISLLYPYPHPLTVHGLLVLSFNLETNSHVVLLSDTNFALLIMFISVRQYTEK